MSTTTAIDAWVCKKLNELDESSRKAEETAFRMPKATWINRGDQAFSFFTSRVMNTPVKQARGSQN